MKYLAAILLGVLAASSATANAQHNRGAELHWVKAGNGPIDPRAVSVGTMADGLPVYVCYAPYRGGNHPGLTAMFTEGCVIGFAGKTVDIKGHSILIGRGRWVPASGGHVPPNAVEGGNEANDNILYVCRARHQGSMYAGKVREGFRGCNFGDLGKEMTAANYEVLVR